VSISSTFYASVFCQYPFAKKSQRQTLIREKLRKALSYKKAQNVDEIDYWFDRIPTYLIKK